MENVGRYPPIVVDEIAFRDAVGRPQHFLPIRERENAAVHFERVLFRWRGHGLTFRSHD
jgi:hypothetical protein